MSAPLKTIGGRSFAFGTLPAIDAVRVEVAIARVIGEPLFKAFTEEKKVAAGKDPAAATESMTQAAAAAVGLIASRMNADELITTMETVFSVVSCEGASVTINGTFTGRNKDLWSAFLEALRVNFGDFLPGGLSASVSAVLQP